MTELLPSAAPPQLELRLHGDFLEWLATAGGTLAVTTYNSGILALFTAPEGRLDTRLVKLARPMGLAFDGDALAVAVREQILVWRRRVGVGNAAGASPTKSTSRSTHFELEVAHATGRLDIHDMAFDRRGLCFATTRFNCAARPSDRVHFRRVWRPAFLTTDARGDCCHLNGLGIRTGRLAMATAFCTSAAPGGWRSEDRLQSGVVIDVLNNRVAARGLCMPHSPRWDGRQWWLCNSGEGMLCTFDSQRGTCEPVAALPGFTRGLCLAAGRAVVGLSRIRRRHILDAPPVRQRYPRLRSGAWLVDPLSGRTTGAVEFVRGGREVYEAAFLPNILRASFTEPQTAQAISP